MAFTQAPLPTQDAIVDRQGRPTRVFIDVWTSLTGDVDDSPARLKSASASEQDASIGVTPFPTGVLSAGTYRVSVSLRITQQATTSGSVNVTIGFVEGGITFTLTGGTLGNTVGAARSDVVLIRIDNSTPVTYSTTYASVGATPLKYDFDAVLEQVEA